MKPFALTKLKLFWSKKLGEFYHTATVLMAHGSPIFLINIGLKECTCFMP